MYAIVPDLHADPDRMARSLAAAGNGRRIAFLGDFIDAGSRQAAVDDLAVLRQARQLIEADRAVGILGNHEMNAILFHRQDGSGQPLRPHTEKNLGQHRSFITRFGIATPQALDWTDWMLKALPLWQDLDGMRLVHAFWSDRLIDIVRARRPDGYLKPEDLPEIAATSTEFGRAVDTILSGPELALPKGYEFRDGKQNLRQHVRAIWWRQPQDWADAVLSVPPGQTLPQGGLPDVFGDLLYPADGPLALVGHYKMSGTPVLRDQRAGSIDFPDSACVYLWQGEDSFRADHLRLV